jgi:hypothetical protein
MKTLKKLQQWMNYDQYTALLQEIIVRQDGELKGIYPKAPVEFQTFHEFVNVIQAIDNLEKQSYFPPDKGLDLKYKVLDLYSRKSNCGGKVHCVRQPYEPLMANRLI